MCRAFSCIATRTKVYWKCGLDSHNDIKEHFKLKDDNENYVPIEIIPNNKDYINPDKWIFEFDDKHLEKLFKRYGLEPYEHYEHYGLTVGTTKNYTPKKTDSKYTFEKSTESPYNRNVRNVCNVENDTKNTSKQSGFSGPDSSEAGNSSPGNLSLGSKPVILLSDSALNLLGSIKSISS